MARMYSSAFVGGESTSYMRHDLRRAECMPSSSKVHSQIRTESTSSYSSSSGEGSIFDPNASPWDHVFKDIESTPMAVTGGHRPGLKGVTTDMAKSKSTRRVSMTMREVRAFDDMFNLLFDAASEQKGFSKDAAQQSTPSRTLLSQNDMGIGRSLMSAGAGATDLYGRLRRQTKVRWTTAAEQNLDRKREEMELCDSDQQLLEWAMREVFGESRRYEEAARRALEGGPQAKKDKGKDADTDQLQPSTYPYLLALLMKTFRDKYADPHLALSMFDHARHLSIPSYVFGCTTPAYNELIETRWRCFRDLRGVCEALEEMRANGVDMDRRTRTLAEKIRREVGQRNLWQEETSIGSGEAMEMLARIEKLTMRKSRDKQKVHGMSRSLAAVNEVWKVKAMHGDEHKDGWEFGKWDDQYVSSSQTLELR
ncbi:hypothetical protein CERSUDRAFT_99785 [Gelatoporia subvermispora B]|uniref:Mtf2-like C-terminal domain-containing protein n=1 Tax=Ceriporiopsis subvermispora (strain B) TaxID=914234 RepID=M2Q5K2_CERS8|nr:hypothetical protein CERSUDRAFT_99785 [Gelatoporia subvermispora B]